jgi:hypothetical protein
MRKPHAAVAGGMEIEVWNMPVDRWQIGPILARAGWECPVSEPISGYQPRLPGIGSRSYIHHWTLRKRSHPSDLCRWGAIVGM